LHETHATTNLCNYLRQVAHDIQLHATLRMQHIYMMLIYMFIHTYQSKCSCTLRVTLLTITMQLIKVWHVFRNWTTCLWTRDIILFYFCFQNYKFIGLISIVKVFAISMITHGTPWNVHWPFDMSILNIN
jgi:hypothetical protein